jgi:8-oxo-dGTP diphosphatase
VPVDDHDLSQPVTLIVDGANVMGSRADGWWRDRAGAMRRLHAQLVGLAERGIAEPAPEAGGSAASQWFPEVILVVEGKARAVADEVGDGGGVRLVAARGQGDDEIADLAGRLPGRRIVVTADRELRRRCLAKGAEVTGPLWLTRLFE